MDLLGAFIGVVPTIAKGIFPDQTAIAQANAQAAAAQAAAAAQTERDKINARSNEKYVMYGLIGVGVLVAGVVAVKLVQD